ncbi:hypothetical protein NEOC95_001519 [Neochlamydia sp. AcF95]|nr:hypothetical protein [Neochlamydia sp. AcF95]
MREKRICRPYQQEKEISLAFFLQPLSFISLRKIIALLLNDEVG